jgi:High potential iron-sulfur protein
MQVMSRCLSPKEIALPFRLNDMSVSAMNRRQLLQRAILLLGSTGAIPKAMAAACVSPDGGDASLRQSLHYVESSPDAAQHCSACSFFSDPKAACGSCMIFNGPANINGHCDSWSART